MALKLVESVNDYNLEKDFECIRAKQTAKQLLHTWEVNEKHIIRSKGKTQLTAWIIIDI